MINCTTARTEATTKSLIICNPSLYEIKIGINNNNAVKQRVSITHSDLTPPLSLSHHH